MASTDPASAIVVRVALPAPLARLRAHRDWAASVGVPPHVTILYPFLPAAHLGSAVRRQLAEIARTVDPFEVRFGRVGRFPGVVYLAPEPAAPFARLTEAVTARFPDFPPYGGVFDVVLPHLTITEVVETEGNESILEDAGAAAVKALPFTARVSLLEVLVEGGDGRWHGRWRIPMGVRP